MMEAFIPDTFWHGGVMGLSLAAGMFFYKFWFKTKDQFFAYFALAFGLFGFERWLLVMIDPNNEAQPFVYTFRMLAFLIIIWAVVDKNRQQT